MSNIKLNKELLLETVWEDCGETELISKEEIGKSRWANIYLMTFKYNDKFYQVEYRQGTGDEGVTPFEYDEEEIMCTEVKPYEVTIIKYRPVED
jgi:hypothetical protein